MRRKPESARGLPDEEVPQEVGAVSGERAASTIIPLVPDVVIAGRSRLPPGVVTGANDS